MNNDSPDSKLISPLQERKQKKNEKKKKISPLRANVSRRINKANKPKKKSDREKVYIE